MNNQIIGVIGIILGLLICLIKGFSKWIQIGKAGPIGKKNLNELKNGNIIRIVFGIIVILLGIIILIRG